MRTSVIRRSLAATATLAVATGCTPQAAGSDDGLPRSRATTPAASGHQPTARTPATKKPAPEASTTRPAKPATRRPSTSPAPTKRAAPKPVMTQGSQGAEVRELQARLGQLNLFDRNPTGYYGSVTAAAVSRFQGAHGLARTGSADVRTWLKVRDLTDVPKHDELYPPTTLPPSKPDPRCLKGRVLCISKSSRTLQWMVNGKVLSAMDVRFGSQYTPTREGQFSVFWKSRHHVSTIYHTAMPYAMFFSGGQAVHYSADFAARGYSGASHGCVNVRDEKKIAALFTAVRNGDKVVIYK